MTLDEFRDMVKSHDLTYGHSDNQRDWLRGFCQRSKIIEAMKSLNEEECVAIWNAEVDRKLIPEIRHEYYWMKKGE